MTDTSSKPGRLKQRADFLRAARGRRVHTAAFTLQAARRRDGASAATGPEARIGFTVTKKVGTAVERNRIRRRLREAVRLSEALSTRPETDYVVVARRAALAIPFGRLMAELEASVRKSASRSGPRPGRPAAAADA